MIIDTHCHYNLDPLTNEWSTHWAKAQAEGVHASIVVGTSAETSQLAVDIAYQESPLFAAIGVHPGEYQEEIETNGDIDTRIHTDLQSLKTLIKNKKIVAVGETGLDYFRLNDQTAEQVKAAQKKGFAEHITFAQAHQLPLIIHVRDKGEQAYADVLSLLKKHQWKGSFILHCISGPMSYVQEAISMGAYIGVAGNVTYKSAEHIRDLVRSVPKERILLETDAPFLPPQQYRGQTCEPWMIRHTAEFVQEELGLSLQQIEENTRQLFPSLI